VSGALLRTGRLTRVAGRVGTLRATQRLDEPLTDHEQQNQ
jgi:hypothetical protein